MVNITEKIKEYERLFYPISIFMLSPLELRMRCGGRKVCSFMLNSERKTNPAQKIKPRV